MRHRPALRTLLVILLAGGMAPVQAVASRAQPRPVVSPELDADALLRLARKLKAGDQPALAVEAYRKVLRAGAPTDGVRLEFADALEAANLLDEATSTYLPLAAIPAMAPGARLGLMRVHLKLGEPARALDEYAQLKDPASLHDIRLFLCRGIALDRLRRHGEAQASYRQALAIDPRSVSARNDLGLSLALDGHYDEAVALLRPLAASADASPRVRQNLALVYGLMGKSDLAAQLGAADLSPEDVSGNARFLASLHP